MANGRDTETRTQEHKDLETQKLTFRNLQERNKIIKSIIGFIKLVLFGDKYNWLFLSKRKYHWLL